MSKRDFVDFHRVAPEHAQIHLRLENWSRWANGHARSFVQPMFQLYRPDSYDRTLSGVAGDPIDAQRIQKLVSALPYLHRQAITWHYVAPCNPARMARSIGQTMQELCDLVHSGRTMLVNRA